MQDHLVDSTIDESLPWYGNNAWLETFADSLHGSGKSSSTTVANNLFWIPVNARVYHANTEGWAAGTYFVHVFDGEAWTGQQLIIQ